MSKKKNKKPADKINATDGFDKVNELNAANTLNEVNNLNQADDTNQCEKVNKITVNEEVSEFDEVIGFDEVENLHDGKEIVFEEYDEYDQSDENDKTYNGNNKLIGFFISIKNRFFEFYATKAGRIVVYSMVGIVAVAALVGIIIGVSTTKADGVSELKDLSIAAMRGRLPEGSFIPGDDVFKDYDATGMLVFSKKLNYDEMLLPENDKYIVQYEITYKNEKGAGFKMTATCPGHATLDPTLLNLTEEYKEPLYLENLEVVKDMPIYVKVEEVKTASGTVYSVTLCFEKDGQVFGVTTSVATEEKIEGAKTTLITYVIQIVTNGHGGLEIL